jgi:cell division protein FtsQ
MDGERRIAEPVKRNRFFRKDCAAKYRIAARSLAVLFLATTLVRGVIVGGHLEYPGSPWTKLPGEVAGLFGLAAMDIEIAGLAHHDPQDVLATIGVKPGAPLLVFDAKSARKTLQALDWVEQATVTRQYPNKLQIAIVEREPFVVWQYQGKLQVVDQNGKPMTGISASAGNLLLHVVGLGANTAASDLVNQMSATPGLFHEVKAAVRVGERRWDLHMTSGLVIALPERDMSIALKAAETTVLSRSVKALNIARIDYRIPGELAFQAKSPAIQADPTTTSSIQ